MRKYIAWKNQELDSPALACPAPLIAPAPQRASPWPAALASPNKTSFNGPTGLTSSGPSAFSVVSPTSTFKTTSATIPSFYNSLMCIPKLLENIHQQNVLRSHMNIAAFKPIPNNEKVDLARFLVKDPNEWAVDDVVAWLLDVAKRHGIPFEEMNIHMFASLNGKQMLTLTEENFIEKDGTYGHLIFEELRKTLRNSEDTTLDNVLNTITDDEIPSTSSFDMKSFGLQPVISTISPTLSNGCQQQLSQIPSMQHHLNQLSQALTNAQASFNQNLFNQQHVSTLNPSLASSLAAGLTADYLGISPINVGYIQNGLNPASPLTNSAPIQQKMSPLMKYTTNGPSSADYEETDSCGSSELKIKKNKDGKPRKRSQHTKGNKLWEFIRDALKDPATCPSVVRWEDPVEGVFRIVESEKLARLWGERKNNTKMTYEKLSRAMRTYYEKQILVPVPKTGLYPKKLVYKFGPGAHGWELKN